jgi:hypothetical protein
MSKPPYRVVQWATGSVGSICLKHFIENDEIDLVGVLVTAPDKIGKDVGNIVGLPPTGLLATDDVEAIVALDADCVVFTPRGQDLDMVCRLLESGKSVISTIGPFYPTERYRSTFDRIDAACQRGGTSFHGCGIYPGFAGDLLPLTLARLMDRIDGIEIWEIADKLRNPSVYIEILGFGRDPSDFLASPSRSPESPYVSEQTMTMVVEGLGKKIEKMTTRFEVAVAKSDIHYPGGVVKAGTVGGQHVEWTAWVDGAPFVKYHWFHVMGDDIEPRWDIGESGYKVVIDGSAPIEMTLRGRPAPDGHPPFLGIEWTAHLAATAVSKVCDAKPGIVTPLDLGIVQPYGLVRGRIPPGVAVARMPSLLDSMGRSSRQDKG